MGDYLKETASRVRADAEWWREVFLLEVGRAQEHLGVAVALVHALCPDDPEDVAEPTDTDWRVAVLAGQSLMELRLPRQIEEKRRQREDVRIFQAELNHVRDWLVALLEAPALPVVERAAAADVLARLGDVRPGVGLSPLPRVGEGAGLPDILWCEVPAGPFIMGSDKAQDPDAYDDESPQHEQPMPYAYRISKYPITNAQFAAFVEAGGYTEPGYWREAKEAGVWSNGQVKARNDDEPRAAPYDFGLPFNLLNHPIVGVTWYEALAFCRWLTDKLRVTSYELRVARENGGMDVWDFGSGRYEVRLPTEAEWEKVARGTDGRRYPWGNEPDPNRANYDETGIGTTSAVGIFPGGETPYGCLDMSGNVWEWCRTKWLDNYEGYEERADHDPEGTSGRVLRGGAFSYDRWGVRCASRDWSFPHFRYRLYGFRVVVSPVIFPLDSGNSDL